MAPLRFWASGVLPWAWSADGPLCRRGQGSWLPQVLVVRPRFPDPAYTALKGCSGG
ncbi:hypothetical protein ACFFX0_16515 [Citricoccus parietis]|uniref:Uncharacterized protein n=1 Tax=Citricoccus parietis TaxID=592307 RepID=A0ABV5G1A4_9MICC